ncbi:MAG: hypothetical protein C0490_09045 [Marivirga sp.]|nr:hypothetical protein [Marivirga sp.]
MRNKKDNSRNKNFNCRIEAQLQFELDEIKKVAGKNWSDDVRLFLWGKVEEYKQQNQTRVLH